MILANKAKKYLCLACFLFMHVIRNCKTGKTRIQIIDKFTSFTNAGKTKVKTLEVHLIAFSECLKAVCLCLS